MAAKGTARTSATGEPMRVRSRNGRGGFTLTELLVVILLIAILTGVMLMEMRGTFEDALLKSCARELMSGLSLASSRAVTLNQAHSFIFDSAKHSFVIQEKNHAPDPEAAGERAGELRKLDERITIAIRDPADLSEENPDANEAPTPEQEAPVERDVIHFYPDGTADRREIILRDRNNLELALRINPVTGRVRVEEDPQ